MNSTGRLKSLAKDLAKTAPRSARDTLGDYVIAARTLDKCRAVLAGTEGEYHFDFHRHHPQHRSHRSLKSVKKSIHRLTETTAPASVLLIRLMVGGVFLSEGIQKFLIPEEVGAGRFERIGLPSPEVLGPLVGASEIAFGAMVLAGFLTRLAVIPLLTIMAVALWSTKLPILLDEGFWSMAHAFRNDICMVLGSLFLLVAGAGKWSFDARWASRPR